MEWKQLKMTASEKQKAKHLQAVEEALEGRHAGRRFDWAMPLTVLFTAVVLCFLVLAPGLPLQDRDNSQQAALSEGMYEKGYAYVGELGKMPASVLVYGVKRLPDEQLVKLEQWLLTGQAIAVEEPVGEPNYEFGLVGAQEKQYVKVYFSSSHKGWLVHLVEENRWLELEDLDLYELVYEQENPMLKSVGIMVLALLSIGYMTYVEKVYMKDEEGRRRKTFGKLWHGVLAWIGYLSGFSYIIFVKGSFIPFGYAIALGGLLLVAYLDRRNPDFKYRKHQYSAHFLYILFFISMSSFVNTY